MRQKFVLFIQIVLFCIFFHVNTNYVLSQETYDFTGIEVISNLSNDEDTPDNTNIQLDNDELITEINVDSGNINTIDDEIIQPIIENEGNQDTKGRKEGTENNEIQTKMEENVQTSRSFSSTNWDNDNFLNSNFWSQNPSDEDIINAIYGSEGDTTFYTLGWPSTCTNMNVVHVITDNGLPSNLSENTIYVLDTDILFLQGQTSLKNCSALVSSRDLEFGTKIYSSEAVGSKGIIYSNGKNFVVIDNVSIDGYSYGNSIGASILQFENSSYNTINNISLYNTKQSCANFAQGSNYNKLNNAHIYNAQTHGISFSANSNNNTINNTQIYNNNNLITKSYAVYILGGSTKNVFNNVLIYNNVYGVYLNETQNNYFNNTFLYNNMKSWNAGLSQNYYYGDYLSNGDRATAGTALDFPEVNRSNGKVVSFDVSWDYTSTPVDANGNYLYDLRGIMGNARGAKGFLDISSYRYGDEVRTQDQPVTYIGDTLVNWGNFNSNLYIGQRIEGTTYTSDYIDPICELCYSTTGLTNQDVVVTLTGCSEEILEPNISYVFTGNGQYFFVYQDLAGNTNGEWAEVNWIDKDNPQCNVVYDITGQTFGNVVATLTGCSEDILITEMTYTFTKNGQHLFVFHDLVGNTGETLAMVDRIGSKTSNGGASSLKKDYCPNGDYSDSYYDGDCGLSENDTTESISQQHGSAGENSESQEYINAYIWAYNNGLLNIKQINNRKFQMELTRIEMSRLLSTYAINILGKMPDNQREFYFTDVSNYLDKLYNNGVSLSYKLGIMGINIPDGNFRPNDTVSNAEFITSLSRMLYETADGPDIYYSTHINLMKNLGVIGNIDPYNTEKFGDVLIILYRVSDIKK